MAQKTLPRELRPTRAALYTMINDDSPDLTVRQLAILMTLVDLPPEKTSVKHLAEPLKVPKPVVTRALDRMADLGLVQRFGYPPGDRRQITVGVTDKGRDLLRAMGKAAGRALAEAA